MGEVERFEVLAFILIEVFADELETGLFKIAFSLALAGDIVNLTGLLRGLTGEAPLKAALFFIFSL